jgi:hypothetical protein
MSVFNKEGDSKQALLDDLQALHSMLHEDAKTESTPPSETPGRTKASHSTSGKIPLLQDIFDPEHPDQEIQVEQLSADNVEQWVTGNLFDVEEEPETGQTADQPADSVIEAVTPLPDDAPDESINYAPVEPTGETSTELTNLYRDYAEQWGEQEIPAPDSVAKPFMGLSEAETEEFIELLIEEHADEILALLKDVLKDQLSLLVTQVRDNDSNPSFPEGDSFSGDLPPGIFNDKS